MARRRAGRHDRPPHDREGFRPRRLRGDELRRLPGLGESHYPVPWSALKYDTSLGGYVTGITESQLRDAPQHRSSWGDRAWKPASTSTTRRRFIGMSAPPRRRSEPASHAARGPHEIDDGRIHRSLRGEIGRSRSQAAVMVIAPGQAEGGPTTAIGEPISGSMSSRGAARRSSRALRAPEPAR